MAVLNSPFLLLFLATTTLYIYTTATPSPTAASPGAYMTIPVDHHVEELAKFAIDEHNRQAHDHLVYSKTLSAERQVVNGSNYRLNISAIRGGLAYNYQAVVYVPLGPGAKPQLTSFKRLHQTVTTTTTATATSPTSPPPPLLGGYMPIPINHHVEKLAKFAIDEHNKQAHDHLVYSKTLSAERQVVNGSNYRLNISAIRGGLAYNYQAVVYVPLGPGAKPQLTSFKRLNQSVTTTTTATATSPTSPPPPLLGGYMPIPINHHVEKLAKFAIDEHNKQAHDHLVYSKTLSAERQVVNGSNYRLNISAIRGGLAYNYQAVVYVPLGPGAKPQLTSFKRLHQTVTTTTTTATATSPTSPPPPLIGGYIPIPIDHHVEELAKFAIDEHNKQAHDHLVYSKTLRAERQLVNGYNYRLAISALDGKVANNYQAVVYVPFRQEAKPQLTSFRPLLQTAKADPTVAASPNVKSSTQVQEAVEEYKKGQGKN